MKSSLVSLYRTCIVALACSILFSGSTAVHAQPGKSPSPAKNIKSAPVVHPELGKGSSFPIEIEGEVVDSWCWSSGVMGAGRGPEHYACGLKCVVGGVSIGIVDDEDRLYIAAKSKAYKGCQELLAPLLGKRVRIKCSIAERGGCRVLGKITAVKDLGPAENFYKKSK